MHAHADISDLLVPDKAPTSLVDALTSLVDAFGEEEAVS